MKLDRGDRFQWHRGALPPLPMVVVGRVADAGDAVLLILSYDGEIKDEPGDMIVAEQVNPCWDDLWWLHGEIYLVTEASPGCYEMRLRVNL